MLWLLIILFLLGLLLALPVRVLLQLDVEAQVWFTLRIRWLGRTWRRWRYRLPSPAQLLAELLTAMEQRSQSVGQPTAKPPTAARKRPELRLGEWRAYWQLARRYLPRGWRALHWRLATADWQLQLRDPAWMGQLFALTAAADWPRPPVRLRLSFGEVDRFSGQLCLVARLCPAEWLWLLLSLVWEPAIRDKLVKRILPKGAKRNARSAEPGRAAGEPDLQQDRDRRADRGR